MPLDEIGQMGRTRDGWQKENLVRYFLYKFSFVSEPSKVADDIGVDFFCTRFEARPKDDQIFLYPKSAFAVQVKSRVEPINLDKYLSFLDKLEIPYFIVIADLTAHKVVFYSGENIQHFVLLRGPVNPITNERNRITAELCERSDYDNMNAWHSQDERGRYHLMFPKVAELNMSDTEEELIEKTNEIRKVIESISENIALRASHRATIKFYGTDAVAAYAGIGSKNHYEENFVYGLVEVFNNLAWLSNFPDNHKQVAKEFKVYEDIYKNYMQIATGVPMVLISCYFRAKEAIESLKFE